MINTETENTIPIDTEVMIAIHQNSILVTTSLTPCQNGVLSNVAVVEGGTLGLLGIKNVGNVNTVDMLATMMSYDYCIDLVHTRIYMRDIFLPF